MHSSFAHETKVIRTSALILVQPSQVKSRLCFIIKSIIKNDLAAKDLMFNKAKFSVLNAKCAACASCFSSLSQIASPPQCFGRSLIVSTTMVFWDCESRACNQLRQSDVLTCESVPAQLPRSKC